MATSYEVSLHVHSSGSVTALRDVLEQSLPEVRHFDRPPVLVVSGEDKPDLLVTLVLPADDASTAQHDARSAVAQAIKDVGITGADVEIGDPEVRAGS